MPDVFQCEDSAALFIMAIIVMKRMKMYVF